MKAKGLLGLALVVSAGMATAQIPDVPGAAGAGAGVGTAGVAATTLGASAAAPTAPTRNLWSMLLPSQSQCDKLKSKFCSCGVGQLLNSMMMPVSGLTGGLIHPICPGPNAATAAALAQPADSAEGAAARIKQEEANAKARIAALQYLATVDCRYFPEATAALINGLRADPNECVRMTAAKSLLVGCCCNKAVITALTRSVNGDDKDGNPGERSECVKTYAYLALQRCLACYVEPEPKSPEPGESPPKPSEKAEYTTTSEIQLAGYTDASVQQRPPDWLIEARQTVARGMNISKETLWRIGGQHTLVGVVTGRPSVLPGPGSPPVTTSESIPQPMPAPPTGGRKSLLSLWNQAKRPLPQEP